MEPELMQQLRVDDPMEEPELNLDGLEISSIQVLLEPPLDDEDNFYSPLDHFQNLVKLSMSSSQCTSLEGFPNLPLLRSVMLADNHLAEGFEALAEADLQNLVRLDLSGNKISNLDVLKPLVALGNLQHLSLAENEVASQSGYRDAVFEILPQLITVDGLDRDGTEIDVDDDLTVLSGDEEGHDEDVASGSDSELEDQENRPPLTGGKGKTVGRPPNDEEEDDDELEEEDEEEDEEDEENEDDYDGAHGPIPHERGPTSDEEEEDEDIEDEEEDEEDEEEDEEGGEEPGLAYLLSDNIQDDNDEEFEPTNEVDEASEMESSEEDEGAPQSSAAGSSNTNGNTKRPRSPSTTTPSEFDQGGFDVDGDGDDTTNGFGMASFDGPATFDDETTHEAKRPRT